MKTKLSSMLLSLEGVDLRMKVDPYLKDKVVFVGSSLDPKWIRKNDKQNMPYFTIGPHLRHSLI